MNIPFELIEQFSRGNGAILVGAGLSIGAGLPSWGQLINSLKNELDDCPLDATYLDVAQYYAIRFGKNRLITKLRAEIDTFNVFPTNVHKSLVQLRIPQLFTTNYDDLLEKALQSEGIRFDLVINAIDANFWTSDHIQLVKFHGDINQPSTVILTSEDYERYFPEHPSLTRLLANTLQTRTLLLIGYSATDIDFRLLLTQVQSESGAYARSAYAVMFDAPKLVMEDMERRGIKVINFISVLENDRNDVLSNWITDLGDRIKTKKNEISQIIPSKILPLEPYKFLNWFGEDDKAIFHGRSYEIDRLTSLVETQNITILYGESGAGKTSLLRAGAIPALRESGYVVAYFRPLVNPFNELKESLKTVLKLSNTNFLSAKEIISSDFTKENKLLIVMDQFEEFFIRQGINTRREFIKALRELLEITEKNVRILISLRSDYLDRMDEFEGSFGKDPLRFRIRLHNLGPAGASAAILEPAKDFDINLDQNLLETLVSDLNQGSVAPPQLQIVCYSLWKDWVNRGRPSAGLTLERYTELGTTENILKNYLVRVLQDLGEIHTLQELSLTLEPDIAQNTAKAILKSLISSERTKITVTSKEITQSELIQKLNVSFEHIDATLNFLQDRRIIRHIPGSEYYELVHEVMVDQIWSWVTEDERRIFDMQDILQRALTDYRRFQTLLSLEYLSLVRENVNSLSLNDEELELLLTSAINYNYDPCIWVERMKPDRSISVLEKIIKMGRKMLFPQIATALGCTKSPKAVRYLEVMCKEENRETQRAAATGMVKLNYKSVIPPLFRALIHEEHLQRAVPFLEALETLSFDEAKAMLMIAAIEHKDVGVRKRATNYVIRVSNSDGFDLLSKQLGSEDTLIRSASVNIIELMMVEKPVETKNFFMECNVEKRVLIIKGLSGVKNKNIYDLLDLAMNDPEPSVRREVINTLSKIGDETTNNLLNQAIYDTDLQVRCFAIKMLGKAYGESSAETLLKLLYDKILDIRIAAMEALIDINSPQIIDAIISLLNDKDPDVRQHAAKVIIDKRDGYVVLALEDIVKREDYAGREEVEGILNRLRKLVKIDRIIDELRNGDLEFRLQALNDLEVLRFDDFEANNLAVTLGSILPTEKNNEVRQQMQLILNRIESIVKENALLSDLQGVDEEKRLQAIRNLRRFKSDKTIDALISCLDYDNNQIRKAVLLSLAQIRNLRSIDVLISELSNQDIELRKISAEILSNVDDEKVVEALIGKLQDNEVEVRVQIVKSLGKLGHARALDAFAQVIKDESPLVREQVIISSGKIGTRQAIGILIEALSDTNIAVRRLAIKVLGQFLGDVELRNLVSMINDDNGLKQDQEINAFSYVKENSSLEELVRALRDKTKKVRISAVRLLANYKDDISIEALDSALNDVSLRVRRNAVESLRKIGGSKSLSILIKALDNKDKKVRSAAALAIKDIKYINNVDSFISELKSDSAEVKIKSIVILGLLQNAKAVEALIEEINCDDINVRQQVIKSLGQIGDPQAIDALLIAASEENEVVYKEAIIALGKINASRVIDFLLATLNDTRSQKRQYAIMALSSIQNKNMEIFDALVASMSDESASVRRQSIFALGQIKESRTVDYLANALNDDDFEIRKAAVVSLANRRDRLVIKPLLLALRDEDPKIRNLAVIALGKFEDEQTVETLMLALNDPNEIVLANAIIALGRIKALQAVEVLESKLSHSSPKIREHATSAIKKIKKFHTP